MANVMKADCSVFSTSIAEKTFAGEDDLWLTYELRFDQAAVDYWALDFGEFGVISTSSGQRSAVGIADSGGADWYVRNGLGGQNFAGETPVADQWILVEQQWDRGVATTLYLNTVQVATVVAANQAAIAISLGLESTPDAASIVYIRNVTVGTSRGNDNVFVDDFSSGNLSAWTSTEGDVSVITDPFPPDPPDPAPQGSAGLSAWRWLLTDLDGTIISVLDRHVHERTIDFRLDVATRITGRVSSADPEINRTWTDGFPNLTEGDRLLYCFRRDYDGDVTTNDPWTIRAAGTVLQLNDVADANTANTEFTAYDPWQILYRRPMVNPNDPILGNLPYTYNRPVNEIIIDLLENMALFNSPLQPGVSAFAFLDWGQTVFFTGTIETLPTVEHTFQAETYIGACLDELCALGHVDIWMEPIWDPVNRPGYTHQLNIYAVQGAQRPAAIFGWDKPLRSTTAVNRDVDGTERANNVRFHLGQGGDSAPSTIKTESLSIQRFGEYWDTRYWVKDDHLETLSDYAQELIDQVSQNKRTVSVDVTPERCPDPFTEWFLGDTVRVFASNNLRATQSGFQRVVAFTLNISDTALETVVGLEIYIPTDPNDVAPAIQATFGTAAEARRLRPPGTQAVLEPPTVVNP